MLTIVTAYKTKHRRKEVPKIVYFGHDRKEARKQTVPEGYLFIETTLVAPGYNRKFVKKREVEVVTDGEPPGSEDATNIPDPSTDTSQSPSSVSALGEGEAGEVVDAPNGIAEGEKVGGFEEAPAEEAPAEEASAEEASAEEASAEEASAEEASAEEQPALLDAPKRNRRGGGRGRNKS